MEVGVKSIQICMFRNSIRSWRRGDVNGTSTVLRRGSGQMPWIQYMSMGLKGDCLQLDDAGLEEGDSVMTVEMCSVFQLGGYFVEMMAQRQYQ